MKFWRDTLAKRLFILMWVALVASNLLAWGVWQFTQQGPAHNGPTPVFPSLPPTPGLGPDHGPPQEPPHGPPPGAPDFHGGPAGPAPPQAHGMSATQLAIDYGLRMLVIALAAWWGSRWLARPMRSLVSAAEQLAARLSRGEQTAPRVPANEGTLEVREAAQVFNSMAAEIEQLFDERGLMLAALSHDLRTPLTRLRLRLEAVDMPEALRDKAGADIAAMNALIDEVLGLFRGDDEPLCEVDVAALVQAQADDWVEQGQPLRCSAAGPLVARARSAALRRVVENLVGNALRYGKDVEISAQAHIEQIVLTVADRGPGIAPELLERVFTPFYRLEASRSRAGGGTGLGLYIARDLCRRMGASLTLANREGGGLLAEIRLPR